MFCPNCGNKTEEKALFCSDCGTKLNAAEEEQSSDSMETPTFDTDGKEDFKELVHVQLNTGKLLGNPAKVLYLTNRNIYMANGVIFVAPDGRGAVAVSELLTEKEMEKEALTMDFNELAASDPEVVIIPYDEIINMTIPKKKKFMRAPPLTIETSSETYNFYLSKWDDHKYKDKVERYRNTIPPLLGDKVTIE